MNDTTFRCRVLLTIQRALLGEVFPDLRAITVDWSLEFVKFRAYVHGESRPDDLDSLSCVSAELSADFEEEINIEYSIIRIDAPNQIVDSGVFVYKRREKQS